MLAAPDLVTVGGVALAEHGQRLVSKRRQSAPHRIGGLLAGETEEQGDLHVRGFAGGRLLHRGCVFMSIDEDQPCGAANVAQGGDGAEQDGTVTAVEKREAAGS
jgi:hypothetical protein